MLDNTAIEWPFERQVPPNQGISAVCIAGRVTGIIGRDKKVEDAEDEHYHLAGCCQRQDVTGQVMCRFVFGGEHIEQ